MNPNDIKGLDQNVKFEKFIHHLIANRVVPADTAISTVLGGPVKLFTSRCVVEEFKRRWQGQPRGRERVRGPAAARGSERVRERRGGGRERVKSRWWTGKSGMELWNREGCGSLGI
ncbi:unnamed protein product [Linum trigynum]|uniref:Uncharacterized protein n=1 Tax=Linum trigynum TaxID=586398 RepID=A0AAV2CN08_9ROSI